MFIFPGIGLAASVGKLGLISDEMIYRASIVTCSGRQNIIRYCPFSKLGMVEFTVLLGLTPGRMCG
jgi:hypothetical protein